MGVGLNSSTSTGRDGLSRGRNLALQIMSRPATRFSNWLMASSVHMPVLLEDTTYRGKKKKIIQDWALSFSNELSAHMFRKMKLAPSPTCNCGLNGQIYTAEMPARQNMWPTAVQLHTKFYSSKKELEKTATFILQTGLSV